MTPNPSTERTATGKPVPAAHIKRWAACRSKMNQTLHSCLWLHREMHWLLRRCHAKGSPGRATPVT
jgi:hypothetical protein